MDKYEYNLKLEEIDKLVDQGDYEEAANLADTIEWKRVRNVRTLCLISEIYEAAGRLADSKRILERAYRKTPVGKNVLYRLVEVTTALQQYDEALEYYTEYVQAAPHDNNRYILKYKLYRGRGSSVEELIEILEEYLGQEYTERWAYELAKLYRQAGQMQKCLAACDDLVLWFHSGKYVRKALELKKKYAALTPKQQQIYQECVQEEAEIRLEQDHEEEAAREPEEAENVVVNIESTDGEVLAERIIAETEKEIAEEVTARKAELEEQEPEPVQQPAEESTRKFDGAVQRSVADGIKAAVGPAVERASAAPQKAAGAQAQEATTVQPQKAAGAQLQEATTVQLQKAAGAQSQEATTVQLQRIAAEQSQEPFNSEELQVNLARSMREIVSGVAKRQEVPEEDMPVSIESRPRMTQKVEVPNPAIPSAGRLSIDDILLSMGERGKEIAAKAAQVEQTTAASDAALDKITDAEPDKVFDTEQDKVSGTESDKVSGTEPGEAADAEPDKYIPENRKPGRTMKTVAEAAVEELTDAQREALQYTSNPEKLLRNKRALPTYEEEPEDFGATRRALSKEELLEAARQELMSEKTIRLPLEDEDSGDAGRKAGADRDMAESKLWTAEGRDMAEAELQAAEDRDLSEAEPQTVEEDEAGMEASVTAEAASADGAAEDAAAYDEEYEEPEEEPYAEEEGPANGYYDEAYEDYLMIPEHLRGLFCGFTEIPELEDQIANAIIQAESKGDDRTSKNGNILIFGAHGSGKTTLAMNLAKAIAQDHGSQVVKMAKIFASDLNKKDIASTVAKIAGGTLIVEEAGDLEDDTVEQLTTAMEFRTDGLIVILEDEQRYVHELLMRHPRFTMKFTAQIYIPEYTVEELAMFGQIYANEQDYKIGEEGLEALYEKISALAGEKADAGETVTISDVIGMVSKAIERANGFFRKVKMGKKRYDENDYIILFAKDFK